MGGVCVFFERSLSEVALEQPVSAIDAIVLLVVFCTALGHRRVSSMPMA